MNRIKFLNISIDNITMCEALTEISYLIENTRQSYVVTPNVDHIVKLEKDDEFLKAYENANLIITDGKPLIWISKLLKTPIKEKISGADIFPKICEMASEKNYTMYFLGAAEGVADTAAKNLSAKYPGLKVIGTCSPSYGFENNPKEIDEIILKIQTLSPDILIVGLGSPKQEKFIYRYRERLSVPVSLALGASLDFASGTVKRAPRWMRNCGLEWLHRLFHNPRRMFKRYVIEDLRIVRIIWKYRKIEE